MTKNISKQTLPPEFISYKGDDGIETSRAQEIPREVTLREGVRESGNEAPPHCHEWGQILYASSGVMQVHAQGSIWVIPPQRAVWIPPGAVHAIKVMHRVTLRNVYLAPHVLRNLPDECQVIFVSPLMRELIAEAVTFPVLYDQDGPQGRLIRVLLDCIQTAPNSGLNLPVPQEGPIAEIAQQIKAQPDDERTLDDWAAQLGTTTRTLARNFRKQTGMTFGQWRQQARLLEALSRLARGQNIAVIAHDLGYSSQSAFSAMFKKALGVTPGQYFEEKSPS